MDADTLAAIPKADLHRHFEWDARLERRLARAGGREPRDWAAWRRDLLQIPPGLARLEALESVHGRNPGELNPGGATFEEDDALLLDLLVECYEEAATQGALVVEVRFGGRWILRPGFMALAGEAARLMRGRDPSCRAGAIVVLPWPGHAHAERVLEACLDADSERPDGVDLLPPAGAPATEWTTVASWCDRLASAGIGITCHAGEFGTDDLAPALDLPGLTRLGHAVRLPETRLVQRVADRRICIEVCLGSNVILGAVQSLATHPIRSLADNGIAVTLNTDDPVRLGTTVTGEYEAAASLGFAAPDLATFTMNAIEASFISPREKAGLVDGMLG